jgi:hypothetical protein
MKVLRSTVVLVLRMKVRSSGLKMHPGTDFPIHLTKGRPMLRFHG